MFLCHIFPALISLPIGVWAYRATGNHWNAESPEFCCTSCYSRSLEWPWSHPQRYACITIKINTVSPQEKKIIAWSLLSYCFGGSVAKASTFWSELWVIGILVIIPWLETTPVSPLCWRVPGTLSSQNWGAMHGLSRDVKS